MHNCINYSHLNLSLKTLFVGKNQKVKIGGLSHSRQNSNVFWKDLLRLKSEAHDQFYLAPEVLNPSSDDSHQHATKIDIFALGVILFLLTFK
jgi:hypothetical protein